MLKRTVALAAGLVLAIAGQGWGESYLDVTYQDGMPGFSNRPVPGVLQVADTGVYFSTGEGRSFSIPLTAIREQGYETRTTKQPKGRGFVFAGPNPILMATTLGVSLLNNMAPRPKPQNAYVYTINYETPQGYVSTVRFNVPDEGMQMAILDDVRQINRNYNTGYNVVQAAPDLPPERVAENVLHQPEGLDMPVNTLFMEAEDRILP